MVDVLSIYSYTCRRTSVFRRYNVRTCPFNNAFLSLLISYDWWMDTYSCPKIYSFRPFTRRPQIIWKQTTVQEKLFPWRQSWSPVRTAISISFSIIIFLLLRTSCFEADFYLIYITLLMLVHSNSGSRVYFDRAYLRPCIALLDILQGGALQILLHEYYTLCHIKA